MAIISQSDLDIRLADPSNAAKGRRNGAKNIPNSLREIIGFNAHFDTARNVAKEFGIAPISAHEQKDGRGHEDVKKRIEERLGLVRDSAVEKMLEAMNVVSSDKIKKLNVKSALAVVETMAKVVEKTGEQRDTNTTQVVIYAPQVVENKYDRVIEIER